MKTRIKVDTYADGRKVYTPQYKFLGFWCTFTKYVSMYHDRPLRFIDLIDCQLFIDKRLDYEKSNTKTKTEIIKYP